MTRITVLFHEHEQHPSWYIVHHLARFWGEDGHDVQYVFGPRKFVPADLCFVHVDLSVVPAEYLEFARKYPVSVNGRLEDIRKSRVSQNLVGPQDDWNGPVIVKSDLNYFGQPERMLGRNWIERRWETTRGVRAAWERIRQRGRPQIEHMNYQVFEHLREVPQTWFENPAAVIEKFLPEIEHGRFHLRIFQVLGDRWRCTRLASEHRVIKAHLSLSTEEVEPPPEIFAWQREFQLDYGKIDFVVHEGRPVLLDLNKTIGATAGYRKAEELEASRRYLAEGLYHYFQ